MLLSVFEKSIFLQSLGWGIVNSFWQAAFLWILYILFTAGSRNLSASFRHHLSLLLLLVSFAWFIITVTENYSTGDHGGLTLIAAGWFYIYSTMPVWLQWMSGLYILLLTLHIICFIKKLAGLHGMYTGKLIKAPVDIRIFATQTAFHIGIKRTVAVWLSLNVDVPSVIGIFKPVILLPVAALNHLTASQAQSVILHELAHIKRNDYLLNLLQSIVELMLFFNPFARLLSNTARKERENCCDDWVLNYRCDKHDYAAALFTLEQKRLQPVVLRIAATNGKKNLLRRIKRLFVVMPRKDISHLQQLKLISLCMLLLAAGLFFSPVYEKKAAAIKRKEVKNAALSTLPNRENYYQERQVKEKNNDRPVQTAVIKPKLKIKKEQIISKPQEWIASSSTLINSELLKELSVQNTPLLAASQASTVYAQLLIEIEEERSGVKGKNKYLLQLKNNNGNPEIKPLIIINKKMKMKAGNKKNGPLKSITKKRVTA